MHPSCRRLEHPGDAGLDREQRVGQKVLEPVAGGTPAPETQQGDGLHPVGLSRRARRTRGCAVLQGALVVAPLDVELGQPPRRGLGHRRLRRRRAGRRVRLQPRLQRPVGGVVISEIVFVLVATEQQRAALPRLGALQRRRHRLHGAAPRPLEQLARAGLFEHVRPPGQGVGRVLEPSRVDEPPRPGERGLGLGQALLLGQRVGQVHVNVRVIRIPRERLAQERLGRREVPARERVLASREAAFGAVERKVPPHASPSRFYCRVAATKERPMSGFAEYERYDGLGLAALVARREVTPEELLEAAIARVEARNPVVNAVTMKLYDYGRQAIAAGLPDGPFRGVPYLMTDLTASIAGVPMTRSSRYYADAPSPTADSEHVRRLKRAGLVIFGRTT